MTVKRCSCGTAVEWLTTAGGKKVPFVHPPIPVADAREDAWTVVVKEIRGVRRPVLVPLAAVHGRRREAIRHVVVRHDCPSRSVSADAGPVG